MTTSGLDDEEMLEPLSTVRAASWLRGRPGTIRARLDAADLPQPVRAKLEDDLLVVEGSGHDHPDTFVGRTRLALEVIAELPWQIRTGTSRPLVEVRELLDRSHFGMEAVKQEVLRRVAVQIHLRKAAGEKPIDGPRPLLLVGPPGTGKTTMARAIAEGEGRAFALLAMGGFGTGEALRSWSRSYQGSRPGLIMNAVRSAGARDALILLDEIDKVPSRVGSAHGDTSAVLLEILDSEQNHSFTDQFLMVPFGLSEIRFVATANSLSDIDPPLLDRMDVVEVTGYSPAEKLAALRQYILPAEFSRLAIEGSVEIRPGALEAIVERCPGPGMRDTQALLARVLEEAILTLVERAHTASVITEELVRQVSRPTNGRRPIGFSRSYR